MAVQYFGNRAVFAGSSAIVSAPSTGVLVTLASSALIKTGAATDVPFRVTWILGCGDGEPSSVAGVWWLDHAKSTDQSAATTSVISRTVVLTAAGQSAQFITGPHMVALTGSTATSTEFFRVIMETTVANAAASIWAEPLV